MSHSTAQCMVKSNKPGWVNKIETYHPTEWPWVLYFYPTKHTPIYDNSVERKKLYGSQADVQSYSMLFLQYYSTLILIIYIRFESVPTKPHITWVKEIFAQYHLTLPASWTGNHQYCYETLPQEDW